MSKWSDDSSIEVLREYLRIPCVSADVNYGPSVQFLRNQAKYAGLKFKKFELVPNYPVVVLSWEGLEPEKPSILLNSHMDVVPVSEEHWTYPPFDAQLTGDGWIYARGAQDMKSIGIMHLEAVKKLKLAGVRLKRTIHLSYIPDEEIGGTNGMKVFARSEEFKSLNVAFALDESMPSSDDTIIAFYGERTMLQFKIISTAAPGHGSTMYPNTAGEKLFYVINKLFEFRAQQCKEIASAEWEGDFTSTNLTQLSGGVQPNVLPEKLTAVFDVRVSPNLDLQKFEDDVNTWCKEAGEGVYIEFIQKNPVISNSVTDATNVYWTALIQTAKKMGVNVRPVICPGATDARFLRQQGVQAFGLSPLQNTPQLLHAHDERIHADTFLNGIEFFKNVLISVANL